MFGSVSYYRQLYSYSLLFGALFKNIYLVRYNGDFTQETEREIVPCVWAAQEKYIAKSNITGGIGDPMTSQVLPKIAYELVGVVYDPARKQNTMHRMASLNNANNSSVWASYMHAPYTLKYKMTIVSRYIEDSTQIVEQILPTFQPDFSLTADMLASVQSLKIPKDIIIGIDSVEPDFDFEGEFTSTRNVTWTLMFSMKAFIFGPVLDTKVITRVIANIFDDDIMHNEVWLNLNPLSGRPNAHYDLGETVYQGSDLQHAWGVGVVRDYITTANTIQLGVTMTKGHFYLNIAPVLSLTSNASYVPTSFRDNVTPDLVLTAVPDPLTANANSVFGVKVTAVEFPNPDDVEQEN